MPLDHPPQSPDGAANHPPEVARSNSVSVPVGTTTNLDGLREGSFRAGMEATRMPIILTDPNQPDNPIVYANPSFISMTGYDEKEILGKNCRFLQGPDTDPKTVQRIRDAIRLETPVDVEILNYRKPARPGDRGAAFWNALFVSPVYDTDGKLTYFFASQLDISRRHDIEQAYRQAQRLESLGKLGAGFAHNFNNTLAVILSEQQMLRLLLKDAGPHIIEHLDRAEQASDRAAELVKQVLAFSRKQTLDTRVTSLNTMVSDLQGMLSAALGSAAHLELQLDPELMQTKIDQAQAEQALLNLIFNARTAMPNSGKVTIKTENVYLSAVEARSHGNLAEGHYVSIFVTDTGTGMPPEIREHVTEMFFTTKESGIGTGMGLSTVSGFVLQSDGWLSIESEVGKGTTIGMYFPAIAGEVAYAEKPSSRAAQSSAPAVMHQVLLVEDDPHVLVAIESILDHFHYRVLTATCAVDALQIVKEEPSISCVLTDFSMPGENGVVLGKKIQALRPELPVILLTGYGAPEAIGGGEHDFPVLGKPVKVDRLISTVQAIIRGPSGVE